jgi:GT2 family glycosyltransferase
VSVNPCPAAEQLDTAQGSFDLSLARHYNQRLHLSQTGEDEHEVMSQPLVYVLIINWNLKDDTAECLHSVFKSDYTSYRVLIVDNGSDDGSPDYLQGLFPAVEMIVNPTNLGFARACNVGIRHALRQQADYVFLLNNDTVVNAGMLGRLVETAETDAHTAVVAPMILYYAQDRVWHLGGRRHRWLPVPVTLGRNARDDGRFSEPFEVDYVAFCGALIRRGVLDTFGLLDERFFFTYEDSDFCRRARDAGFRVLCEPRARMWHKVSVSAQKDSVNVRYLKAKSRAMFYRLHPHGPHPWLTIAYVSLSTFVAAAASMLRGNIPAARATVRGWYHGYREELGTP